MAALHSALQSLGPCNFANTPTTVQELEIYLGDLFHDSQLILESVPIPAPEENVEARSETPLPVASKASEISSSLARSIPPIPEFAALQKEWGKPIRLAAKENPLNMAVYKMGGKDSRGAWFARRSVHEGIGFSRFKKALEMEFPETLTDGRAPGKGNIRGIGGDRRLEDTSVSGKGRLEVFQLSAQFPGPTTPRDFVTLLTTSSNAMKQYDKSGQPDLSPRHYIMISKPCDHPEAQPRDGYVRGNYESLEFIREVPRRPRRVRSSMDLNRASGEYNTFSGREAILHNARKPEQAPTDSRDLERGNPSLPSTQRQGRDDSRRRGQTIAFSEARADDMRAGENDPDEIYDPELNPVEWIMITRSDPGGSVPRFLVERGTPGSIVADASKFLDWACQKDHGEDDPRDNSDHMPGGHRASLTNLEANGHLAGINIDSSQEVSASERATSTDGLDIESELGSANQSRVLSNMSYVVSTESQVTPDQPIGNSTLGHEGVNGPSVDDAGANDQNSDTASIVSFASADSHLEEDLDGGSSETSSHQAARLSESTSRGQSGPMGSSKNISGYDKELQKHSARRAALDSKLVSARIKWQNERQPQSAKEKEAIRKAEDKHHQEIQRQDAKYKKAVEKLDERQQRQEKRTLQREEKQKGAQDRTKIAKEKNEGRSKTERERDEAREELGKLQAGRDLWLGQIRDLQRENTALAVRMGKLEKTIRDDMRAKLPRSDSQLQPQAE